jgi:hypothetical protein
VSVEISKEDIEAPLVQIRDKGRSICGIRESGMKAEDLEPNVDACMDFGGCPFIDLCKAKHPLWRKKMSEKLSLKDKLKAKATAAKVVEPAAEVIISVPKPVKTTTPQLNISQGFTLNVDCYPTKGANQVILFVDYIQPALARIAKDTEIPHYKLLKYGEGPGLLCAELLVELQNNPIPDGATLYVETIGNLGKDCLDVLEAAATFVNKRT